MENLLERAGHALYGDQWQSAVARDLGVSDRTVRRWVADPSSTPHGIHIDLHRLCLERAQALDDVAAALKATMP